MMRRLSSAATAIALGLQPALAYQPSVPSGPDTVARAAAAAAQATANGAVQSGAAVDSNTIRGATGATGSTPLSLSLANDCYDVRMSDAKLDLATDDTAAFLDAVSKASVTGGPHCVFIPKSILLNEATLTVGQITIVGSNSETDWIIPFSTSVSALHLGTSAAPITGVKFREIGFVQPAVGAQTAGAMINFDYCFDCWVEDFFSRNAWNLFTLSANSGSLHFLRGHVRTVINDLATVNGSNDQYFDQIVADYDTQTAGVIGNSDACFVVNASAGSLTLTNSDFIHCGTGMRVSPVAGAAVKWLFVNNVAFDTCTSAYGGQAILFQPSGVDGSSKPSAVMGGKFTNVWAAGCGNGVMSNPTSPAYVENMAFDNFTGQGETQEAVYLKGNSKAISFVNPELWRNANTYPNFHVAGNAGNFSIVGGHIGGQTDTTFPSGLYGVKIDATYAGTAAIIGTDLCGYASGGGGLNINGSVVQTATGITGSGNITVTGSACAAQ